MNELPVVGTELVVVEVEDGPVNNELQPPKQHIVSAEMQKMYLKLFCMVNE